jgi:multiple sugar transport system ATP-binding protein
MASIQVDNIAKSFGNLQVLKSVSLEVRDREFTVLLGPSGCGKTTLLRIIAGLDSEASGIVRIGDREVNKLPPRARNIAMVFQNYAVFPHMTVFDNIAFGLRMKKSPEGVLGEKVRRAAELMHIEEQLPKYSGQLSGGQRQRVAVARALAVEPEVLLMDEPLSNLDALLRLEMRAELKGLLQALRTTTLYVTHDQVEAMSLADRIAVMYRGRIIQYEAPVTVYKEPATIFVGGFMGNPPMNFLVLQADGGGVGRLGGGRFRLPAGGVPVMGIRPEDLEVVADRREDAFEARVAVVEPLGPNLQLTLSVDGQSLRVTTPSDLPVSAGSTLLLRPNPERIRWYDKESGAAIAS